MSRRLKFWGHGLEVRTKNQSFKSFFPLIFSLILKIDFFIWIPVLSLSVIGILFIYSSGINVEGNLHLVQSFPQFAKQILWLFLGILLTILIKFLKWRDMALYSLYLMPLLLIIGIITIFLPTGSATHSWIRLGSISIQPSEITKPFFILSYAFLLNKYKTKLNSPVWICVALLVGFVPILITLLQNDMGTASVYVPILFIMLYKAGGYKPILTGALLLFGFLYLFTLIIGWRKLSEVDTFLTLLFTHPIAKIVVPSVLAFISIIGFVGWFFYKKSYYQKITYFSTLILAAFLLTFWIAPTEKGYGFLGKYQIERLVYPIDSSLKLTTSYNIDQARTAIGSGGLTGKGFLKGNLSHRRFVPEQPTDFIFSILAEEWGWFGCFFLIALYGIFLMRILWMIWKTQDETANWIQWAFFALFTYHMFVNIGMNIGVVPVIGIPLMFVSYGGSAIWSSFISVGILENIWKQHKTTALFNTQ